MENKTSCLNNELVTSQAVIQSVKVNCAFCGKLEGTESITDSETQREILICEVCENDLNWYNPRVEKLKQELTAKQEDYMIESQMEMIRENEVSN